MKRFLLPLLTAAILLPIILLSSCSSLIVLKKNSDGLLVNKSKNLAYSYAPTYIEPISVGDEYAIYQRSDMVLHEIPGLDPTKWLCEEYSGSSIVFFATDIEIPTLDMFEPKQIYICVSDAITISVATVDDANTVAAVTDAFVNGAETDYPLVDSRAYYQLKFTSDKYPGIYYNLIYAIFDEGSFIYDRSSKRCVSADGLLDSYIDGDTLGAAQ